jgi:16S rRNA (guanine527-N7)-methyltransferase
LSLEQQLQQGLVQLGLSVDETQTERWLAYLHLLHKWNAHFNLSAVRDINEMLPLHLLDSLSIHAFVEGPKVLDVGTGAGLPGIPLAILLPQLHFTLLDANSKKTRFCKQAVLELKLDNVDVIHSRVEQLDSELQFKTITTRAFAALPKMLALLRQHMLPATQLLAMKGQLPQPEIADIEAAGFVCETHALRVPLLAAERHLLIIRRGD